MGRAANGKQSAYFIASASETAGDVQRALTDGAYRCNIMMVANGEQAMAILRHENREPQAAARPHVFLIYGGLTDGRAAKLVEDLRADSTYGSIPMIAVVAPEDEAEDSTTLKLDAFGMSHLQPLMQERGFWWVMAKLG